MQAGKDINRVAEFYSITVKELERTCWHHSPDYQKEMNIMRNFVLLPLSSGENAIIDPADAVKLCKWSWTASPTKSGVYAQRNEMGKKVYLHRQITEAKKGQYVDHINGNTLDNRNQNLRIVSQSVNVHNRPNNRSSKTGLTGAYKRGNKFISRIKINGESLFLGTFETAEEAHKAYNERRSQISNSLR